MKTQVSKPDADKPAKKHTGKFASEAEFLAEKNRQFQAVFGKVDWEKAKSDGLIP